MRILLREKLSSQIRGIIASGMVAVQHSNGMIQIVIFSTEYSANMIVAMPIMETSTEFVS